MKNFLMKRTDFIFSRKGCSSPVCSAVPRPSAPQTGRSRFRIPTEVIGIFHWLNRPGRAMALGTQLVTEISTRDVSWAETFTTFVYWLSRNSGSPYRDSFTLTVGVIVYCLPTQPVYMFRWSQCSFCVYFSGQIIHIFNM
jgi:hypothetical protein